MGQRALLAMYRVAYVASHTLELADSSARIGGILHATFPDVCMVQLRIYHRRHTSQQGNLTSY